VRSGSAAAVGVGVSLEYLRKSAPTNSLVHQEEQQLPAAAYQVYVCGPGTMAAAVGRALNKMQHSSGARLAAPVLLHNINQSL
jgi:ferredoxin-NADP reductase